MTYLAPPPPNKKKNCRCLIRDGKLHPFLDFAGALLGSMLMGFVHSYFIKV